jgi:perosamine synthetase
MNTISMVEISLTEEEVQAATAVLRSGALRQGKECEAFEQEFAQKTGAKYAVTSASGTAALHIAYMSFLEKGDEVLVPSFTFFATASSVAAAGGTPVFCDMDPGTLTLDLKDAERKITERTRAISPVHIFGNPCDIPAVQAFAAKHCLRIVWDAAQAHGARYDGRDVGGFGDFACYSFYPSKNMFVGEGGITTTGDEALYEKMRVLRSHGETGKYIHTLLGLNYRMTDVEAAIGRKQLGRLDDMLARRRRNAEALTAGFRDVNGIRTQTILPKGVHAWHQYAVMVDEQAFGISRDALSRHLTESGIMNGVVYPLGLHSQPVFEDMLGWQELPVTEAVTREILCVPVHHGLKDGDVERIVEAVREAPHGK